MITTIKKGLGGHSFCCTPPLFCELFCPLRLDTHPKSYRGTKTSPSFLSRVEEQYFTVFEVPAESKCSSKRVSKGYNMALNGGLGDEPDKSFDTILTWGFASQSSHLITHRLRELNVYRNAPMHTEAGRSIMETQRHHLIGRAVLSISG